MWTWFLCSNLILQSATTTSVVECYDALVFSKTRTANSSEHDQP